MTNSDNIEYIRLYVNPYTGSEFNTNNNAKFNISKRTRNFINNIIINNNEKKQDTETVDKLNHIGNYVKKNNGEIDKKHHLSTYLDNIHLTIDKNNDDNNHLTIAFKDKSRIFVHYNIDLPIIGRNIGFTTGMEGKRKLADNKEGNAQILAGVISVVEHTIKPLILQIYSDRRIQPQLRKDEEPVQNSEEAQSSSSIIDTPNTPGSYNKNILNRKRKRSGKLIKIIKAVKKTTKPKPKKQKTRGKPKPKKQKTRGQPKPKKQKTRTKPKAKK